jgi:NitT/TauT family transport system ATP-binding protein
MRPSVAFDAVTKRYGDGPAILERISLRIAPGEFVSFIGPSGCGKSTLLKLVAGLSPVTSGALAVDDHAPALATPELAFVFQEPTLLPWLNVERNVEVPLRLRGESRERRRERARAALALVGLTERAQYYPRQLSGGQRMRVSIARALSLSPKLLLLDEPFGALDEMTRDRLNEELLAIRAEQGWTALFVTHAVAEAVFLSNRIILLAANPGRIHREISIDLPYPRTTETRLNPAFQSLVASVSQELRALPAAAADAVAKP